MRTVCDQDAVLHGYSRRIDGLRGAAILLVVAHHVLATENLNLYDGMQYNGVFGVTIFFVVSGYLITGLLLRERDQCGTVSLRKFYARRALRILPAFYVFVAAMLAAWSLGYVDFGMKGFLSSALYLRNIINTSDLVLQHTWSLAVEQQFYVVWPLLVVMFAPRCLWCVVAVGVFAKPWLVLWLKHGYPDGAYALMSSGHDSLSWGCGLALLARSGFARNVRLNGDLLVSLAIVLISVLYRYAACWHGGVAVVFPLLRNAGVAMLIWAVLSDGRCMLARILESRVLVCIGVYSYGMYLWQQPFVTGSFRGFLGTFPYNILSASVLAVLSYKYVEMPFLRMKARFAVGVAAARKAES